MVFDLDGTLVDSRRDLATAVNRVRQGLELEPLRLAEVVARVGHGARNLVRRSLPEEVRGEAFERAFEAFREHYLEVCLETTRLYPGVGPLVAALGERVPLALLTNKPEAPTRKILAGLRVDGKPLGACFGAVLGGDSLPTRKPAPEGLLHLAEMAGVRPAETLLVGDSEVDGETAAAAGARFALVGWGYGSREVLGSLPADLRVGTAAELGRSLGVDAS